MLKSTAHIGVKSSAQETSFFQEGPRLGNLYEEDTFLQQVLERLISTSETWQLAQPELSRMGDRGVYDMMPLAKELDVHENQPRLVQYDAWGRKVDEIVTHPNWKYMHRVAAEEGVISDGYNTGKWGPDARLVQYAKLYLYAPVSGLYSCPLAMTDGAARYLINLLQQQPQVDDTATYDRRDVEQLVQRLLSRDPAEFITSGQWMTERAGGSDVGQGTETIARRQPDGTFALFGYKWFTSATDAHMALTLARIEREEDGQVELGSNGLSCFLVKLRDGDGQLNGIKVHRMKHKFGTKQLPTAEMELAGTSAVLVSAVGRGIPAITTGMVNITRLHNAISACAAIHLVTALARDYSHRRMVFGSVLASNALHVKTLAEMELSLRACVVLTFDAVAVLGRVETAAASEKQKEEDKLGGPSVAGAVLTVSQAALLVRLLTPLAKAYTAKLAVQCVSEGLEMFGGQGYMESSGLPQIYRDAQVLPIWEGTTNVLAHDVLRVLTKSKFEALEVLSQLVLARCHTASTMGNLHVVHPAIEALKQALVHVRGFLHQQQQPAVALEANARELALSLARIAAGSCLLEHAVWSRTAQDALVAVRWCTGGGGGVPLVTLPVTSSSSVAAAQAEAELDSMLALNADAQGQPQALGDVSCSTGKVRARF